MNFGRNIGYVFRAEMLPGKGLRQGWYRLGWPGLFPGQSVLGNRFFFDREYGLPVCTVEHKNKPMFGDLRYGINCFSIMFYGDQVWVGREVAVPQIVVYYLVVPDIFPGGSIQGDQAVGIQVSALTFGAVKVLADGKIGR